MLLTKIYPDHNGLKIAWQLMASTRDDFSHVKYKSKIYEKLRLEVRNIQSLKMSGTTKDKYEWRMRSALKAKQRTGNKHNLFGFKHSDKSKIKMSNSKQMGGNSKARPCELEIFNLNTIFECSCLKESWIILNKEKILNVSYDTFKWSFRKNKCSKYFDLFNISLI